MFSPESFGQYAQWSAIATVVFIVLTLISFLRKFGFRFRLIGATGFMGVLTFGLFTLSLMSSLTRVAIPNAARYSLVYDLGGRETVIAVAPDITEPQLEATLEQAAYDLFSPGRLAGTEAKLLIRARTVLHPSEGTSEPLFLGQVKRSLTLREDPNMEFQIFANRFKRLPQDNLNG